MKFTRRDVLALGSGAVVAVSFASLPAMASASDDAIKAFTGGMDMTEGGLTLTAPEIAENGNTVPVEVSAEGAEAITLLALGNPTPAVATFKFGPLNPSQSASTRIRLAKTQDVLAIAKMKDGTFRSAKATVKVTIGGCGG
ncbi:MULTISPECIES: thiosulfate oxidation carrier protein SoxY [Cohaesibacter]|uniref:thiosulfate oxidation carrier protein SoxY n=1 Tax=Cohaesibacter TaxID=655352 RepID=UPI000DEAC6FF|nr:MULTISPECIES: thiosulfate oxidation carrier protein SoxY [Cohaesibacter]TLP46872.1 thiosulfate oxidation carrier protein SoxY [Cohaesibacter sp. CAU 1516]